MKYRYWIFGNFVFLIGIAILSSIFKLNIAQLHSLGQVSARVAIIFFFLNLSMFFIFMVIKKVPKRNIKIFFVKLSRKFFKTHIPFAVIGTTLIIVHAAIMILTKGNIDMISNTKFIIGYFALLALIINLTSGKIRYNRATGPRRKFHLNMAVLFGFILLFHIYA